MLAGLAAVSLVAACSSGDGDDTSGTTTTAGGGSSTTGGAGNPFGGGGDSDGGDDGGAPADPASLTGAWEGTYECAQGATALRLTIDDRADGSVGAAFEFHSTDDNPDVPSGGYSMTGTKAEGTLVLEGHEWLRQVRGYTMVGVRAEVGGRDADDPIEGTVVGAGCTDFHVERTSADPWYVGTWRGAYGCNQGVTGLTLTIEGQDPGHVSATYEFYAVPDNPGVPDGSFRMTGTYDGGRLALQGSEWIEQPPGYVMVGYESNADLGVDPHHLFGTVIGDGCTLFTMDKVES